MDASPLSCTEVTSQAYQVIGTISVDSTGVYELADGGNLLGFNDIGQGIMDLVISVYEGEFDPLEPAVNRVITIDEGEGVALDAGTEYILVLQPYCENESGVFAVVVRGPGLISGPGFISAARTFGTHTAGDETANFPGIGTHVFDASAPYQAPATGLYHLGEIGLYFNAGIRLFVYRGSFNPEDTALNLVDDVDFAGSLFLEANQDYVFVAVDQDDLLGAWQYLFFPPGQVYFNASIRGAWVTPGVEGAGIMVELGEETGVLFFAWFTFPESAQALAAAREEWLTAATGGSQGKTSVGSTDQRWLTAFGAIPPQGNFMSISYENTTGGAFDQTSPIPTTNSAYGTGTVELIGCSQMEVTYDLPGGVSGSAQMYRIIPDGELECYRSTPAGPVTP